MTANIRLAFLANGKNVHTKRWLKYFVSRGYDVHLITFTAQPIKGVEIHELRYLGRLAYPVRIWKIRETVKKVDPDILHAHYIAHYGIYGSLAGFHPFIVSVWGSDVLRRTPKETRLRRCGVVYALRRADYIATTAEFMKGYLVKNFSLHQSKVVRIPWGTDLNIFCRGYKKEVGMLKRLLGIETDVPVILSNRHMNAQYEIESIVDAIPFVLKSHPNAVFIFIRGHGLPEFEDKMKLKTTQLEVGDSARFVSKLITPEEMAVYLNMADMFLSIPKTDQFGTSVIEGMACGSVPIVSDIEAYHQYLRDGTNALFVDPEFPQDIAGKITHAINHPEIRNEFYTVNRRIVEEKEDWNRNAEKMEELYKHAMQKARS